ncbi:hypothetical protein R1sor_019624 [Riccia sorocarpa]|uniref:2-carboxy-D-arabinitol-1-phosphatase n=1 Tax=Riccia sorocarpa TaxID=122646 RepID=A0ABD3IFR8_9MARC
MSPDDSQPGDHFEQRNSCNERRGNPGTLGPIMARSLEIRSHWLGLSIPSDGFVSRTNIRNVHHQPTVIVAQENSESDSSYGGRRTYPLPCIQDSKRVVLVRHGQSTWNEAGRIQGSSDFSRLTSKGENQAEISRQMLQSDSFDVCIHSPLSRAKRTAEVIWGAARNPNSLISIDDLREIDLYAFQGLYKVKGKELFGEVYTKWKKDPVNFLVDGHYPVRELWERASGCWGRILGQDGSSILVVAHNAVNQALVATAIGFGPTYFRHLLQSNCGVSVLDFTPGDAKNSPPHVCLQRLNQTPASPLSDGGKSRTRIVLVCHGATGTSQRDRFASSPSEPLSPLGTLQSTMIGEHLLDNSHVHSIVCGPELRTSKTAELIAQGFEGSEDFEISSLEELRDFEWGEWRGRSKADVALASTSNSSMRWQDELRLSNVRRAESFKSFWSRTAQGWDTLRRRLDGIQAQNGSNGCVVVVGHNMVNEAMLCHCLNLDESYFGCFRFDSGSISVIDFPDGASGKGVVRCLNYTSHLDRWAVPVTRRETRNLTAASSF